MRHPISQKLRLAIHKSITEAQNKKLVGTFREFIELVF